MSISCSRAVALVLSPVGDATEVEEARSHVLNCPACASTLDSDDRAEDNIARIRTLDSPPAVIRALLTVLGLVQVVVAVPWIFGSTPFWDGGGGTAPAHLTRDGTIGLVVGLAAVAVSRNARLAYFALPVCSVLSLLHVVTYFSDRSRADVAAGFEAVHVLTFAVTVLVGLVAFPLRRSTRA